MGYSNKTWACPFFKWDERLRVHCEGGCVAFPDMRTRTAYIDRFCAAVPGWTGCTVAEALTAYYEGQDAASPGAAG